MIDNAASQANKAKDLSVLLLALPPWIQNEVKAHKDVLEEIVMDEDEPLHLRVTSPEKYVYTEQIVTRQDIDKVSYKVGGFKDNGRAGFSGLLHRVSDKRDSQKRLIGLTIRYANHVYGVAEPLRPYLERGVSMLLIGAPGSGKTTLERDMVRISAERYHKQVCVCDSAGEIGGHGKVAHPAIGKARRFHVPQPSDQTRILMGIIQNHSPEEIYLDELGYEDDVAITERAARSGTAVKATVHGRSIHDVLENPTLYPLLGYPDRHLGKRAARPTFEMALEVRGKGEYVLFTDLAEAVDALLRGEDPEGVPLGKLAADTSLEAEEKLIPHL